MPLGVGKRADGVTNKRYSSILDGFAPSLEMRPVTIVCAIAHWAMMAAESMENKRVMTDGY